MSKSRKVPSVAFVRPEDNFMNSGEYGDDPVKLAEYMRKIYASSVPDQPVAQPREAAQSLAGLNKSIDLLYGRLLQVNEDVINTRQFDVSPIFGLISDVKREATQIKNPSDFDASAIGNRASELADLADAISLAGPKVVQSDSKIMKELRSALAALNQVTFTRTMASEMAPPTPPPPKPPAGARAPPPLPEADIPDWARAADPDEVRASQAEYIRLLEAAQRASGEPVLDREEVEKIVRTGFDILAANDQSVVDDYVRQVARDRGMSLQTLERQIGPTILARQSRLDALAKRIKDRATFERELPNLEEYEARIISEKLLSQRGVHSQEPALRRSARIIEEEKLREKLLSPLRSPTQGGDTFDQIAAGIGSAEEMAAYASTASEEDVRKVAIRVAERVGRPVAQILQDAYPRRPPALSPLPLPASPPRIQRSSSDADSARKVLLAAAHAIDLPYSDELDAAAQDMAERGIDPTTGQGLLDLANEAAGRVVELKGALSPKESRTLFNAAVEGATKEAKVEQRARKKAAKPETVDLTQDRPSATPIDEAMLLNFESLSSFAQQGIVQQLSENVKLAVSGLTPYEERKEMELIKSVDKKDLESVARSIGVVGQNKKLVLFKMIAAIPAAAQKLPEKDQVLIASVQGVV
jgi:hypothetical protein